MATPRKRTALIAAATCVVLFIYVTIKGPTERFIEDVPDDVDARSDHLSHCSRNLDKISEKFVELRIPEGTHGQGGGTGERESTDCIFSIMTDIDSTPLVQVLGYSMIKEKSKGLKVMLIPKKLDRGDVREDLEATGWIPVVVGPIYPTKLLKDEESLHSYMKLHMWAFTECKSIIYLDVATIATKNFDELHDLFKSTEISDFAAVFDSKNQLIDTAVMVFKPNLAEYHKLLKKMCTSKVKSNMATGYLTFDGLISQQYSLSMLNLPAKYNVDSNAWAKKSADEWQEQQKNTKIIHYTKDKPGMYVDLTGAVFDVWYYARNDMIEYLETHHTHE